VDPSPDGGQRVDNSLKKLYRHRGTKFGWSTDSAGSQRAHNRGVAERSCTHENRQLETLRTWAWVHGRTDIVRDLDLHASAWAFLTSPDRTTLTRLVAVLPTGDAGDTINGIVSHLVDAIEPSPELRLLQGDLGGWCHRLCVRVTAGLGEMEAEGWIG
jgi:hypothetical protein